MNTHTHIYTLRACTPTYAPTLAQCTPPNPYRAAHEHTDTAPSIMVNTSNSISFLDSWGLDRHGSDNPWFLTGCLPLQLPHFSLFPMKSAWAVTEHAAKIDSLTYYLLLFVSLYNVMFESHLYNKMTLLRSFRGWEDVTMIFASPKQQTLYFMTFSIFFWHQQVFLTTEIQLHLYLQVTSQINTNQTELWNAFNSNLYNSNTLFFRGFRL